MGAITIRGFRGEIPRTSPRLLQPNQATRARNIKLTSGRLDPLPETLRTTTPGLTGIKSMFRYRCIDVTGQVLDNWLVWNTDVDAVESPLSNDTQGKVYFSSEDFEPRMSAYSAAISGPPPYPHSWYVLGVTPPIVAPGVSVAGGTGATEARAYLYTFVTQFGEESAPSPVSAVVTGFTNGTWNLSGMQAAPANTGTITAVANNTPSAGYVRLTLNTAFGLAAQEQLTLSGVVGMTDLNRTHRIVSVDTTSNYVVLSLITTQTYTSGGTWTRVGPHNTSGMVKRIYRSAGLTNPDYLFVAEIASATTTYADTLSATALGESIATLNVLTPPKNLKCLISLPNGCLAGISGNELCFSDPYIPYSWPADNRYSFSGQGVAISPAGNSVIVLTDTFPVLFIGSDPEAMSPSVMETYAPCASKRGVVNIGGGCVYPSHDGLWLAVPGNISNITKPLYRAAEWAELNPTSFVAELWDGQYFASYLDRVDPTKGAMIVLDIEERDSISFVDTWVSYLLRNEFDGKMYVLVGDEIHEWAGNPNENFAADWVSGTLQVPRPMNFGAAQVHADYSQPVPPNAAAIAANTALLAAGSNAVAGDLGGESLLDLEINSSNMTQTDATQGTRTVQFTLYVDGIAKFSRNISSSLPFRLPAGYLSEVFNIGLSATVPVYSAVVGASVADLAGAES